MNVVRLAVLMVLVLAVGTAVAPAARAQALVTASKGSEIGVFGGYMGTKTDFGQVSKEGFAFGANFTLFTRFNINPALEVRYDHDSTAIISQRALLIGPRVSRDIGRFHPYADYLVGTGRITYHPVPYPGDNSDGGVNKSFGVGVDIDVHTNYSIKLDVQSQSWDLGTNYFFSHQGNGDYTLTPRTVILGVTYHIPFAGLKKQRELR